MKNFIILLVILSSLTACKKILDISVKDQDRKIVMNGIMIPDSVAKVYISASLGVLETTEKIDFLNNAKVDLYENGVLIETLKSDTGGFFYGTKILNVEKSYKIVASDVDIKNQASANFSFLPKIAIQNIDYSLSFDTLKMPIYDNNGNYIKDSTYFMISSIVFNVTIDDPAGENFYLFDVTKKSPKVKCDSNYYCDTIGYYDASQYFQLVGIETSGNENEQLSQPVYLSRINFNNIIGGAVIPDAYFGSSHYTIKANTYFYGDPIYNEDTIVFKVNIYSVPKDLYTYATSYEKYMQNLGNPFSEPVNILSNVEGGIGFVTTANGTSTKVSVLLPQVRK